MKLFSLVPLLLALLSNTNAEKRAFAPRKASAVIHQMPRGGGASPFLDKTTVAKTWLIIFGAQRAVELLAPTKTVEFYGLSKDEAKNAFLASEIGGAGMSVVLIPALQIFQGMSFQKSVGFACFPYIFMTIGKLLNGKHGEIGMPYANGYLVLVINTVVCYAALAGLDFAPTLIKIYGIFSAINGVLFLASPKAGCDAWKLVNPHPSVFIILRMISSWLIAHAVACLTQAYKPQTTALEVVGYIAAVLGISSMAVVKDFFDAGIEKSVQMYLATQVGCLVVAYYLLK